MELRNNKGFTLVSAIMSFAIISIVGLTILTVTTKVPAVSERAEANIISEALLISFLDRQQRVLDREGLIEIGEFQESFGDSAFDSKISYRIKEVKMDDDLVYAIDFVSTTRAVSGKQYSISGSTVLSKTIGVDFSEEY